MTRLVLICGFCFFSMGCGEALGVGADAVGDLFEPDQPPVVETTSGTSAKRGTPYLLMGTVEDDHLVTRMSVEIRRFCLDCAVEQDSVAYELRRPDRHFKVPLELEHTRSTITITATDNQGQQSQSTLVVHQIK